VNKAISESRLSLPDILRRNRPDRPPGPMPRASQEEWETLSVLAMRHGVAPLLWHRIKQKGLEGIVPSPVAERLRTAHRQNAVRNLSFYGELRRLLAELRKEGIPLIPLKGIFLAEAIYDHIGLRPMSDIDVLARPADLARIVGILEGMGYARSTTCSDHHLPPLIRKGVASFEVHWALTPPNAYYHIDPEGLWERAAPATLAGCEVLALSPEDLLLHLCVHTSCHHRFDRGLRDLCDIAETISRFGPALHWEVLINRTVHRGWQRGVYLALRLARELADAKVPEEVLETLRPTDLTEAVVSTACSLVLGDKGAVGTTVPVSLGEFMESRRLRDRIRILRQRVFLPRTDIARLYSVPVDSMRIYGCYPRRLVDLLRRHGHTLKRFRDGEAPLIRHVDRTNHIAEWLSGKQGTL
jgi:hypothetical protein